MLRNHEHLAALNTGINRMHQSIRILAVFIVCKQGQDTQVINFCFSCGGGNCKLHITDS